jgi:NADPH-dependent glutamate synthase beta subunit-like oxidoreductase
MQEDWPFIEILGLLCHAPCEKACARAKVDGPVKIRALHRYFAERQSKFIQEAARVSKGPTGNQVAIWGSGPSGLMAAWRLSRKGHQIIVLESDKEPGGTLRNEIFASQTHREAITAMLDTILASGIEARFNTELEKDVTFEELLSSYDAVVITGKDDRKWSSWLTDNQKAPEITLRPDPRTLQVADSPKVFVCRDISDKRTPLVNALALGSRASESVHRYLSGVPLMWERGFWHAHGNVKDYAPPYERAKHARPDFKEAKNSKKKNQDAKISQRFTKEEAVFEAGRCLSCGRPFDQNNTCWYCLPCEIECPFNALEVRIPYLLR